MIYFLHGPDTYRSRRKLSEIIAEFQKKSGGTLGVTRADVEESPGRIFDIGRTASLFSAKELVVVENAVSADGPTGTYLLKRLPEWKKDRDLVVVFWEAEVDVKSPLAKGVLKHADRSQEFKKLDSAQLAAWITAGALSRGVRLAKQEQEILARRFGTNLWAIANELDKVASGWRVSWAAREEERIWNFTDAFLNNRRSAFRPLASLLDVGFETYYLIGALAGALRNFTLTWYGLKTGKIRKAAADLDPYVARKNAELARGVDVSKIKSLLTKVIQADLEIKTGRLPPPLPLFKMLFR